MLLIIEKVHLDDLDVYLDALESAFLTYLKKKSINVVTGRVYS